MRCNHCADAPCVEICPTGALFDREDGIVDFDNDRCIGCKSCMQACPYDALYINPENQTAAKCNYCAHRIDIGLEPACVNVCPEHAIISGDMENPQSEISLLLASEATKVRKPEKNTSPNLFYIDADDSSLMPTATPKEVQYLFSAQVTGVGHFAKEAEKLAFSNGDAIAALQELESDKSSKITQVEAIMQNARRAYDAPDKGILWGWEVPAYVWSKAIASGLVLVFMVLYLFTDVDIFSANFFLPSLLIALVFLAMTGIFLIMDLDRPDRFHYVLLRPKWNSWLVKGGYSITVFGGLVTAMIVLGWFGFKQVLDGLLLATGLVGILVAVYTAFLFAQAKGRDFWQSPVLPWHMLVHALAAGASALMIIDLATPLDASVMQVLQAVLLGSLIINTLLMFFELSIAHPTRDITLTVELIKKGKYRNMFWWGTIVFGNLLPIVLLLVLQQGFILPAAIVLIGIYISEKIWVEAPQQIPLS